MHLIKPEVSVTSMYDEVSARITYVTNTNETANVICTSKSSVLMVCSMMDLNFAINSYSVSFNGKQRAPSYFGASTYYPKWQTDD